MTFDSSNKDWVEKLSDGDLLRNIREAMSEGCIHPSHVFDQIDELIARYAKAVDMQTPAVIDRKKEERTIEEVVNGAVSDAWEAATQVLNNAGVKYDDCDVGIYVDDHANKKTYLITTESREVEYQPED